MSKRDLCIMACVFCKDPQFRAWVDTLAKSAGYAVDIAATEADAKEFILQLCGITSRNELDTNHEAAKLFHDHVRKPYLEWRDK